MELSSLNVDRQRKITSNLAVRRRFVLIAAITLLGCLVAFYLSCYAPLSVSKRFKHHRSSRTIPLFVPNQKTILYWNGLFGASDYFFGEGNISQHCETGYNNCFGTSYRDLDRIDSYDVILFHGINGELSEDDLPKKRSAAQKYVFIALESPATRHVSSRFDDFFNSTATYQSDSDVIWSYGDTVPVALNDDLIEYNRKKMKKIVNSKSRVAAWYSSNCNTVSRREKLVADLEENMPVDKFGKCFEWLTSCPRNRDCFREHIEPNYFFYLAFENSLCQDYVTEKFFNALRYHVVPVVYGAANYTKIAPPRSFINVQDFGSPQLLAQHLLMLTKNLTRYEEFFSWKEHYRIISPKKRIICDLCKLANQKERKSYNISKWYSLSRC
ncbi:hypothetical protein QAD02_017750 [Eretmocerus hayati]|uniref:Uncharacterized protein n=1 Tax=Eretmocerus hayati TaxID=131215 RepID=A0ACC2PFY2_9HYME|nr:hypothetical protein QAD02_017750 [Eretmocerus hayati]